MSQNRNGVRKDNNSLLLDLKKQLIQSMSPEERKKYEQEQKRSSHIGPRQMQIPQKDIIEFNKRKPMLYKFLAAYKQNSGIYINNFFRKRDFKTYCEDKFEMFTLDPRVIHGCGLPNIFDDPIYSLGMINKLGKLEDLGLAYYPIDVEYIEELINLSRMIELSRPLEQDRIFFRGCTNLERNGVNGLVSVSSSYEIAEQFSRGTILAIDIPKGTRMLSINAVRPKEKKQKDFEQEYLLPPLDCEELRRSIKPRGNEPNNRSRETIHIHLRLSKTLDLLGEFFKVMTNPPEEYIPIIMTTEDEYWNAYTTLQKHIQFK